MKQDLPKIDEENFHPPTTITELLHAVDLLAELQPRGAWGTLSPIHTEVLQAPKPQMRLNPQA